MNKEEIIEQLNDKHLEFAELVLSLNEKEFTLSVNNKWTAGQQLEHICLSLSPLVKGLVLPVFIIRLIFGKANRPSKDYEALVKKYNDKLGAGGVAPGSFIPKPVSFKQRDQLKKKLLSYSGRLCSHINGFNEQQLDTCILPHPLMGKITLREMMYFTIYHVQHHQKLMLQNIAVAA